MPPETFNAIAPSFPLHDGVIVAAEADNAVGSSMTKPKGGSIIVSGRPELHPALKKRTAYTPEGIFE